jgi:cytochrome c peroxidase
MQLRRNAFAAAAILALWGCGGGSAPPEIAAERALSRLEQLGKDLFFDIQLSNPRGQSCASCHDPMTGFAGNFASPIGVARAADGETLGLRNTPTAAYGGFAPPFAIEERDGQVTARGGQFLDGRAMSLEEQAVVPFFAAGEMNLATPAVLAARVAARPYAAAMREEFGAAILDDPDGAVRAVGKAIAAFERTSELAPFSSRLDRWLERGEPLAAAEAEGLRLFVDPAKGDCASCHAFDPGSRSRADRLFTDFTYRALGTPRNATIPANADPSFFDLGLCGPRRERVADDRLCGAFKVPTLRNVARKEAFMHNGVFRTLRDAVAFHAFRDSRPGRWYPSGAIDDLPAAYRGNVAALRIQLDDAEVDAITAFLRTLDD